MREQMSDCELAPESRMGVECPQMIRFSLFGVTVCIHPTLWLTLAVLGGLFSCSGVQDLLGVSLFVVAGFICLLAHEMGHAVVGRFFAHNTPEVHLAWLGGDCSHDGAHFTRWQGVLMTLAGPLSSLLIGLLTVVVLCLFVRDWGDGLYLASFFLFNVLPGEALLSLPYMPMLFFCNMIAVSFWWSVLNLLPVFPLDGGQIMHGLMRSPKLMHSISLYVAITLLCVFCVLGIWIAGLLMLALAVLNYRFRRQAPY